MRPLRRTSARHALAPLEPHDGKRLMMVRSPASALNFFLMSEDGKCQVEKLATVTIPTNSDVETDPELRLIAVNEKRGEQYDKTWLYRVDWIRQCKGNGPNHSAMLASIRTWTGRFMAMVLIEYWIRPMSSPRRDAISTAQGLQAQRS